MSFQDNSSDFYLDGKGIKLHIFLKHRLELINYANNLIGCPHRAEDIVQEAFVKFDNASHSGVFKKPTAYLFRIVRNLAIDSLRKHIRESKVVCQTHEYENIADDTPTPEKIALYKSEWDLLKEAISELPERTQRALILHRINGLKLVEIARTLGISTSLAQVIIFDGMKHCRRKMYKK